MVQLGTLFTRDRREHSVLLSHGSSVRITPESLDVLPPFLNEKLGFFFIRKLRQNVTQNAEIDAN